MSIRTITGTTALAALVVAGLMGWSALDEAAPSSPTATVQETGDASGSGSEASAAADAQELAETSPESLTPAQVDELPAGMRAVALHARAEQGPEQPIPFSHRFHVSDLQLDCAYCHTETRRAPVAEMPSLSVCMGCHQTVGSGLAAIDTLRAHWSREEQVPWQRIYKVPEFVQFKHQPHLRSNVACQECHGPVEEMDRVYKFSDLSMGWCLSCHREDPAASDVATDALLVEAADIHPTPEGRQPVGLYPRAISSAYASQRAPIDCAACHY